MQFAQRLWGRARDVLVGHHLLCYVQPILRHTDFPDAVLFRVLFRVSFNTVLAAQVSLLALRRHGVPHRRVCSMRISISDFCITTYYIIITYWMPDLISTDFLYESITSLQFLWCLSVVLASPWGLCDGHRLSVSWWGSDFTGGYLFRGWSVLLICFNGFGLSTSSASVADYSYGTVSSGI